MILVTGAGGKTGRAVITALAARGAAVRALVRSQAHQASLIALGAREVIVGPMDDADALRRAMRGTAAIYHICPNVHPHELRFATLLAAAATDAFCPRLVYHSVLHPQIEAMPHHWNKLRTEEMLFGTALDVTILQPTAYMQNCLAEWDRMASQGIYRVPYPVASRLSLVDLDEVAEIAALVLTTHGHAGATYELVGTPPLSQIEIADAFGRALRRPVRAEAETIDAWDLRARDAGLAEEARQSLIKMFQTYARDGLKGNPNVLNWLLGRPPTSLAAWAARMAVRG
jgi:uncharacterized protein YbjT (DUF2867 family)